MSFPVIAILAILALGILAALLSIGDKEEPIVKGAHDCASCSSHDDGSCKLACLMDEAKRRKEAQSRADSEASDDADDGDDTPDAPGAQATETPTTQKKTAVDNGRSGLGNALTLLAAALLTAACSVQNNNSQTRWWHAFHARYNTYYNASQAYIDGCEEQESGHRDDYTQLLPIYVAANKESRTLGAAQFDRAIEKSEKAIQRHSIHRRPAWTKQRRKTAADIEWLNRREYNPFLWHAWLLLGKSQFQKGQFEEAAATFGYMARLYQTQPVILARARAWQAKCYAEMGWRYETEDLIVRQHRDSIPRQAAADWHFTLADHYLRTQQYDEAARYLRLAIGHERRRQRRARLWYILGQVETLQNHHAEAYDAYRHVARLHPPFQLAFNAQIAQTEVMAHRDARGMIGRLKRMARQDNNRDYLDQIYYAIGNILLAQQDTLRAIDAYEEGNRKSTRQGTERGALLLQLGHLYWQREAYADARRCYGEAIGLIDARRKDHQLWVKRSEVLDELVPHTDAILLEDSLQRLASMPEDERNHRIDQLIERQKKADREARRQQEERDAEQRESQRFSLAGVANAAPTNGNATDTWYFYNAITVAQGRERFRQQWGKRTNDDDWQRSNRTVVAMSSTVGDASAMDAAKEETTLADTASVAHGQQKADPYDRNYYIAQLPLTAQQRAASDARLRSALLQAAVILKDKVGNKRLAHRYFQRLLTTWPTDSSNDLALYHLYLMALQRGADAEAGQTLARLQQQYPESQWTRLLSNPYYADNQRFGQHLEDSLYAATYEAFRQNRYDEVAHNSELAAQRFPQGDHQPKFMLIDALRLLNEGKSDDCARQLQQLVERYPDSEVSGLAGQIVRGIQQGRSLNGRSLSMGDIWQRHQSTSMADSLHIDTLSTRRDTRYVLVLAFHPDSVNQNQLLYEVARHNFTSYLVRSFEINMDTDGPVHRLTISGFLSYDEALQYAHRLYAQPQMMTRLAPCRRIIISEENLPLLGTQYSYDDYEQFFHQSLAPVKIDSRPLLTRPETIVEERKKAEDDADEEHPLPPSSGADQPVVIDFDDDFYR